MRSRIANCKKAMIRMAGVINAQRLAANAGQQVQANVAAAYQAGAAAGAVVAGVAPVIDFNSVTEWFNTINVAERRMLFAALFGQGMNNMFVYYH